MKSHGTPGVARHNHQHGFILTITGANGKNGNRYNMTDMIHIDTMYLQKQNRIWSPGGRSDKFAESQFSLQTEN